MAAGPVTQDSGVPELQGPPEVLEAIDRFLADPSSGIPGKRPQRKERTTSMDEYPEEPVDEAELEDEDSEVESYTNRHWLLIVGLGVVGLGLLIRWYLRRK